MAISRKELLLGGLGASLLAFLAVLYVHKAPNPDQGIFDYIGWIGLTGGRYYVDVAEQNFPGEMLLHEWAFRLFGLKIWAYRALDFGILTLGAGALWRLFQMAGVGHSALVGAAVYEAGYISSNGWVSGQRDVIAANFLLFVGYAFVRRLKGGGRVWLLPLGLCLFFAILLRPTYLAFGLGLMVTDWLLLQRYSRRLKSSLIDSALIGLIILFCVALFFAWGAKVGSLAAFREQGLLFNLQAYSVGHSRLETAAKLAAVLSRYLPIFPAVVAAIVWAERRMRWDAPFLVILGIGVLAPVSAMLQNKGFGYHLGALLPPIWGLAGIGMSLSLQTLFLRHCSVLKRMLVGCIAALALFGLLRQARSLGPQIRYVLGIQSFAAMMAREETGLDGFTWNDMVAAASYAQRTTAPDETILVWGRPVSIHLLAQRRSATRFITFGMLLLAREPFEFAGEWAREFSNALVHAPPRLVFLPSIKDTPDYGASILGRAENGSIVEPLRRAIDTRYEYVQSFGSLRAYRRRE